MAQVDTIQEPWKLLTQASVNVTTLDDLSASTAPYLAYGTTWATTSVPHAAQNPSNWPSNSITLPLQCNAIMLCFLVADTDNDQVTGTLWTQNGNGPAFDLLTLNPIQAGTAVCSNTPVNNTAITSFRYADTITVSDDNSGNSINVETTADGMAIVGPIDLRGAKSMFFDWDTDAGSGTDGTDGICLWREF